MKSDRAAGREERITRPAPTLDQVRAMRVDATPTESETETQTPERLVAAIDRAVCSVMHSEM